MTANPNPQEPREVMTLEPCPFCQSAARQEWLGNEDFIACSKKGCAAYELYCLPEEWNRRAIPAVSVVPGAKVLGREPTEEMVRAVTANHRPHPSDANLWPKHYANLWRRMFDAAPSLATPAAREAVVELVAELDALEAKVSPGPWRAMCNGNAPLENGRLVGQAFVEGLPRPYEPRWVGFKSPQTFKEWCHQTMLREDDAEFICKFRNAWPTIRAHLAAVGKSPAAPEVDGEAVQLLDEILDIWRDGRDNEPGSRCYAPEALADAMKRAEQFLALAPAAKEKK